MKYLNIYLGKWFGVPVTLHWSWVLLFLFILYASPTFAAVFAGVFLLVLLHECGHCVAAQHFGIQPESILLLPFGGAAHIHIPADPWKEFVIAIAGPAVNVAFIPIFAIVGGYHELLATLGFYNIILIVFNAIPAFPMDGGRVLRAALSHALSNHYKATLIAGRIGQGFCIAGGIYGIITTNLMLPIIAVFIGLAAQQEIWAAKMQVVGNTIDTTIQDSGIQDSAKLLRELNRRIADHEDRFSSEEVIEKLRDSE